MKFLSFVEHVSKGKTDHARLRGLGSAESHLRVVATRCSLVDSSGHRNIAQGVPVVLGLSKEPAYRTCTAQVNGQQRPQEERSMEACTHVLSNT